jgi:uncharacterized membrane protein YhaH (DUF805 family)
MTFVDAIRSGFTNFAQFRGVAKRSEYWWFFLFSFLVGIVTGTLDAAIWGSSDATYLNTISSLILFLPTLSMTVRRFRDAGFSWLWLLLLLVPISGIIAWTINNFQYLMVFNDFVMAAGAESVSQAAILEFMNNNPEVFQAFGQLGLIILILIAIAIFHFVITLLPTKKPKVDPTVAPITY